MRDAIASLEVKLKTMGEGQEEIPQLSITPDLSPGKSLISAVGPSHSRPMSARPMSARRRSEPNLGIIPEEWKRKGLGEEGKEGGGGRMPRNSIKLSEKGKYLDVVSLLDDEVVTPKKEEEIAPNGLLGENLANRSIVMDMGRGGGANRMFSPGGGAPTGRLGGRQKSSPSVSPMGSPTNSNSKKMPNVVNSAVAITPLHLGNLDKHIAATRGGVDDSGYSSSESVSSVSSDISITRKKKRDKRLTTGGLDDVIEESIGSSSAREEIFGENAFGGEVCELAPSLVKSCCCSSGDLGHTHNLSSSWIPTGLFPQSCVINFTKKIDVSKVLVDCSGAKKLKLIVGSSVVSNNPIILESPELPPTAFLQVAARHTDTPNIDILDTPREGKSSGAGLAMEGVKKFWSAGHLGHQHSPSPGVVKVKSSNSGAWAMHAFNVESVNAVNGGKKYGVTNLTLIIEEAWNSDMFVVVRNLKILGVPIGEGKALSPRLSSRIGEAVGGKGSPERGGGGGGGSGSPERRKGRRK
ncbi:hypothetical protein TrLO_g6398 [Triparma laevis f. longispina]|uniref:Uncharacterized protein n=1 Tax=Triparma laevis f. longispina TaxID=1714387 RepID=A0A9W7DT89_9STRA|nr:hypothetical protein TrLO_g6398 [Triparma laevis f. longispina]